MRKIELSSFASKFQSLNWIDYILIISPLRSGIPHRISRRLPSYKYVESFAFLLSSILKSGLKIFVFSLLFFRFRKERKDSHNHEMLIEVLTDNFESFYKVKPNRSFEFINVARVIPNDSGILCPTDFISRTDIPKVVLSTMKELFAQIILTLKIKKKISLKHKLVIVAWKLRHTQDFIAAKCLKFSKFDIKIYVDWFENQVIDATIASTLSKRNCKIYYVSDYLVDIDWHLNLNPKYWHFDSLERHFGAIVDRTHGSRDMAWWSTRLFCNRVAESPPNNKRRVVFIYPFQVDLAKKIAIIQNEFTKIESNFDIRVKRHPNSNFRDAVGQEIDFFYKNDLIVSVQTSLITELYYQGIKDIVILQLNDLVETGLPEGTYRVVKGANEIVS